ncbi:MAG: hypothetical protein EOR19_33390 [Mesorhizobium sp.]|nr:MAG: hypothetical protein EOR19_33390 [Mesorhizobium sp.]
MPIAAREDAAEMRAQFKEICKKMPHMHVELYDGAALIDERQPNAFFISQSRAPAHRRERPTEQ